MRVFGSRIEISNPGAPLIVGAVLFAQKLSDFRRLARKVLRVVIYRDDDRFETLKEEIVDLLVLRQLVIDVSNHPFKADGVTAVAPSCENTGDSRSQ